MISLSEIRGWFSRSRPDLFVLCAVTAAVWFWQWPTLDQPLLEQHSFRQTQTAFQTVTMYEGWGTFLHPKLPVLGAPWEVPFEFPIFQYTAVLLMRVFSLGPDVANRSASLIWFSLCLVPLWQILRLRLDRVSASAGLVLFALCPIALQWSRASLIEFCAVFFGLCFVLGIHQLWTKTTIPWFVFASVAGCCAGLVKATTLATFAVMATLLVPGLIPSLFRPRENRDRLVLFAMSLALVGVVSYGWRNHADHILEAHEPTRKLSSANLSAWNYGTLEQRRSWANWEVIIDRIDGFVVPRNLVFLLVLIPLFLPRHRRLALAALSSLVFGVAVFFNLYFVHDYYLVAVIAQASIVLAVGVAALVERAGDVAGRTVLGIGVTGVLLVVSFSQTADYRNLSRREIAPYSNELTTLSTPDQQVIVGVNDWDPTLLYHVRRKGIMADPRFVTIDFLRALPDLDKYDFYQGDSSRLDVIGVRGWYAPAGMSTIRMDDSPADLSSYPVVLTASASASSTAAAPEQSSTTRILVCGGDDAIALRTFPVGSAVRTEPDGAGFVFGFAGFVGVPVGASFTVQQRYGDGPLEILRCLGQGSVRLTWSPADAR